MQVSVFFVLFFFCSFCCPLTRLYCSVCWFFLDANFTPARTFPPPILPPHRKWAGRFKIYILFHVSFFLIITQLSPTWPLKLLAPAIGSGMPHTKTYRTAENVRLFSFFYSFVLMKHFVENGTKYIMNGSYREKTLDR